MAESAEMNRRQFVVTALTVGGGLALGLCFPQNEAAALVAKIADRPWESLVGEGAIEINPWLVVGPDDTVAIRVAQSEMGQATFTSWSLMVAEELECDWSKVRAEYASVNRHFREAMVYQRMNTASSSSVRIGREILQQAGASARERLMAAAAQEWGVPRSELTVKEGVITHAPTGRKLRYGQVAQKAVAIHLAEEPKIKTPDQFTLMNKPTKLLETSARVDGSATYGIDVRLPGMLYAAVKASPVFGGKPKKYDASAIQNRPGVHSVVEFNGPGIGAGVAVVADSYWRAKSAVDQLPIEWDEGPHAQDDTKGFFNRARAALDEPGAERVFEQKGDAASAIKNATKVVEAVYEVPYLDHAPMEPMNCTAHVTADRVDVWAGAQNPEGALLAVSELTGVPQENVHIHVCFLGGGFGRRLVNDDVRQAVVIAKQVGRPVKVIWSREETTQHGAYRPMRITRFQAGLGPDGMPVAWINRVIGIDNSRPNDNVHTVQSLCQIPYVIPNQHFDYHLLQFPIPTGAWTSVGRSQNEFFLESFIDELAHAAGEDPCQYRRALVEANTDFPDTKGWLKVLDTVVEKSGWGKKLPAGTGMGIAIGDSRRLSRRKITICAVVATISVSKRGEVRAERFDVAIDTGPFLVNPLAAERQVEMQVVMGLTAALYWEITIEKGRVVQSNFDDYPLLRLKEMPEVAIHFVRATDYPIQGIGEEVIGWVAPAVCNALFTATGKRIRSLPLKNHDLSWA
ncbi:MAG: xanthine dehydrogenase family protein molybdopterin-binding subunit [Acidobacteria bacterium]|nr:xanthine dehydrogenase family protein molybdopterin-binding subunit [Acidobacteriota bacterium]